MRERNITWGSKLAHAELGLSPGGVLAAHHAFSQQPHPTGRAGEPKRAGWGWAGLGWAGGTEVLTESGWALDPALSGDTFTWVRDRRERSKTQTGFASSAELMAMWRAGPLAGTCPVHQPLQGRLHPHGLLKGIAGKSDGLVATPLPHPSLSSPPSHHQHSKADIYPTLTRHHVWCYCI